MMNSYHRPSQYCLRKIDSSIKIASQNTSNKTMLNITSNRNISILNRIGNHCYYNKIYMTRNMNHQNFQIIKRKIQLPAYHPKYKKPEWVFDLDLDPTKYRGLWRILPVPPKARPACYVFCTVISMEYICFTFYHYMMLAD